MPTIRTGTGSDVFVERLSHDLSARSHDVITTWYPHAFEIFPYPLKGIRPPASTDIIHANSWSAFAFSRARIPLVVTMHHLVHDPAYTHYRSLAQAAYHKILIYNYERLGIRAASKVVAVSEYTANVTAALFRNADIVSIPNGIDTNDLATEVENPSLPLIQQLEGKTVILFLSRIHPTKGLDLLVPGFMQLADKYPDSVLVIAGPDEFGLIPSIQDSLQKKNLEHRVFFPGMTTGELKRNLLARADLFVLPSYMEGFSMCVLEALGSAKPVIITQACHFPEVERENAGIIIKENLPELTAALDRALSDAELRNIMGNNGRKLVLNQYQWARIAEKTVAAYEEVLHRKS